MSAVHRLVATDFPIGGWARVKPETPGGRAGLIGRVVGHVHYGTTEDNVALVFDPSDSPCFFHPAWLERGRFAWIPDEAGT